MASVSPAPAPGPVSSLRTHLDTLTGARGVAAMLVFLTHCGMEPVYRHQQINQTMVDWVAGLGESAVSFFFMLSGFVLMWAVKPGDTRKAFWRRRVVKIYPNVAVTWLAGLILMVLAGEFTGLLNLLPSLALIHVWIPVETVIQGVDGPAWSLACEIFFYALFPFLMVWVARLRRERLWRWAGWIFGAALVLTVIVGLTVASEPKALGQDVSLFQAYILVFFPPVRLLDFVLGMVIARIVLEGLMPSIRWAWVWAALAFGWIAGVVLPAPLGWVVPMMPACILVLGRASASDQAGERNVLNSRMGSGSATCPSPST